MDCGLGTFAAFKAVLYTHTSVVLVVGENEMFGWPAVSPSRLSLGADRGRRVGKMDWGQGWVPRNSGHLYPAYPPQARLWPRKPLVGFSFVQDREESYGPSFQGREQPAGPGYRSLLGAKVCRGNVGDVECQDF